VVIFARRCNHFGLTVAVLDLLVVLLCFCQGRSQEFAKGGKTRSEDGSPPAGSRGRALVGVWGEAPSNRRHMLNIRLNKAIDRHKSRTVQSPIIL